MEIVKHAVASGASETIRQIGSALHQVVNMEVGRDLSQAKLPSCYDWLVGFITWLDNSVRSTDANGEEARSNHQRIQMPSAVVIIKGSWVLKGFRFSKRKVERII